MMPQYLHVLMPDLIRQLDGRNCHLSNVFVNLQKHFHSLEWWLCKGAVLASHRDDRKWTMRCWKSLESKHRMKSVRGSLERRWT